MNYSGKIFELKAHISHPCGPTINMMAPHNLRTWNIMSHLFIVYNHTELGVTFEMLVKAAKNHKDSKGRPDSPEGFIKYCVKNDWLVERTPANISNMQYIRLCKRLNKLERRLHTI